MYLLNNVLKQHEKTEFENISEFKNKSSDYMKRIIRIVRMLPEKERIKRMLALACL